jgi:hypothetical protein
VLGRLFLIILKMPEFALINIAHVARNPKSTRAAFRILGFFDTSADARAHLGGHEQDVDAFLVPCSKWIVLAQSNESDQQELLNTLGRRYQEALKDHEREFEENMSQQKTGVATRRTHEMSAQQESIAMSAPVAPIGRNQEIRMQSFAIISIIQDTTTDDLSLQQPAIILWNYTETEAEARTLITEELSTTIKDVCLDVVSMYEWAVIPTFQEIQKVDEAWRDPKLDDIMKSKKAQSKRVRDYESECEREGRAPACIEIDNCPATDSLSVGNIPLDPPVIDADTQVSAISSAYGSVAT